MRVALAAAGHDIDGRLAPAIARAAPALAATFVGIALNLTDATDPKVVGAAQDYLNAQIIRHPADEATIGWARRNALALALGMAVDAVLYCDFDHMIRWIEADPANSRPALPTPTP